VVERDAAVRRVADARDDVVARAALGLAAAVARRERRARLGPCADADVRVRRDAELRRPARAPPRWWWP
jgi:hypothetical protein